MFEFSPYHIFLVLLGIGLMMAYWLPRFFSGREPAASALVIVAGLLVSLAIPDLRPLLDPTVHPIVWEHVTEIVLIVSLFGTGLRIDRVVASRRWLPTVYLLIIGMPICIALVAFLGIFVAGMTLAGAVLLGAILAPTDPVLAGDVQVGPPLEGGEHPVRLTLTSEAGLNDGLAFPFVHLALLIAAAGSVSTGLLLNWLMIDVFYRIAVGVLTGVGIGIILAKVLFEIPRKNPLAETGAGVVAIAGILLCYGAAELVEGYGFVASFIAGVTLRRFEARHEFHRTLHGFTETVELTLTIMLLGALGAAIPALWPQTNWAHVLIGMSLIFIIRPLAGYLSLWFVPMAGRQRAVIAFYGVRGIGSIYYIAYATSQIDLVNESGLWSTVALTIFASTIVHGLTAGAAVERATARRRGTAQPEAKPASQG